MFKTKNLFTAILIATLPASAIAQGGVQVFPKWSNTDTAYTGQTYNVLSTDYVPGSRMRQHQEFLEHNYVFPAKPRNMWEFGVGAGFYNIFGDVPDLMPWDKGGYGLHASIRKAWGYVISSRLLYNYGVGKGLQWQESRNYRYNPAWTNDYYAAGNPAEHATDAIHYNYRMESHQLNFDMMATANNIRFHKARSFFCVYGFVGISALAYKTYVNSLNGDETYDYCEILGTEPQIWENRKEIRANLQKGMDNSYEHAAESEAGRGKASFGKKGLGGVGKTFYFLPSFGGGVQIRLTRHVNISIEDRLSIPIEDDLLDGQRWAEQVYGSATQTQRKDVINYMGVGLNFNIGSKRRSVEPLYWVNPMVYAYSQLSTPTHMKFPELELADDDEDGIANSLDKCPDTPKGVAVDSHGCPLDTDGDTVPDYLDWQLITPTECQPSDEHGIGKCPCPECPPYGPGTPTVDNVSEECRYVPSGNLVFGKRSAVLSGQCKMQLDELSVQLRKQPTCKVLLKTFPKPKPDRYEQSKKVAVDRLNSVVEYLRMKGVSGDRIRWKVDEYMDEESQTVEYMSLPSDGAGWPVHMSPRNGNEDGTFGH